MKTSSVRQYIVQTAADLFYQNGYNATGINQIIAESGIAKATLYNHFRSKEDICLAYLRYKNAAFTTDIQAFCSARPTGRAQILALFDFLLEFFEDRDFNGCWCIKTIAEIPKDNQRIRAEIQQQKKGLIQFINPLLGANQQPENLARSIYLLYESAVSESHLHQSNWCIQEAKNLCARILS